MAFRMNLVSAAWLFAFGTLAGCAGCGTIAGNSAGTRQASLTYSADGSSLLSGHEPESLHPAETTKTPPRWSKKIGDSVVGAAQAVGDTVSGALDGRPNVDSADDPASLASMPADLDPSIYIQSALRSEQHGDIEASQRQYEKAVELDPRDTRTAI
ncbi:MAG: hypothetical protein JJ992_04955, partial [Planctomycetes bacterium]|nr:hypothetical protein [Planctomycetota bacterium]